VSRVERSSKAVQPSDCFLFTMSSPSTRSAPASVASRCLSPLAITRTIFDLPKPSRSRRVTGRGAVSCSGLCVQLTKEVNIVYDVRLIAPGGFAYRHRKSHNTKEKPGGLGISMSNEPSPAAPGNSEIPNDPSPISGHSASSKIFMNSARSPNLRASALKSHSPRAPLAEVASAPSICYTLLCSRVEAQWEVRLSLCEPLAPMRKNGT
jgi:hypothetical protein